MTAAPALDVAAADAWDAPRSRESARLVLTVLTWATWTGATVTPRGAAGVAVLAPDRAFELPADVAGALDAEWRAVRAALDATHAALRTGGYPGWPAVRPALLTVAAWADVVRAGFDDDTVEWWEERAGIYEYAAGVPRWIAECQAVEDVVRERLAALRADGEEGAAKAAGLPRDFD